MYTLRWKNPTLNANKAAEIAVPIGSVVSDKASLRFTGKGAANYGAIQQENLMRLLESFADGGAPQFPTVGQQWFDTTNNVLKICSSTSPVVWKSLGGLQVTNVGDGPPSPATVGDIWFQRKGPISGAMFVYTGTGRYPATSSTIGGWNQIWPQVEMIAGREEYDYVLSLVNQLIGPTSAGGNAALGKLIPDLVNLSQLDLDLRSKFAAQPDANVVSPPTEVLSELQVDPTSNDWDQLLAAAKFAVNRLDLPSSMIDDISPVPFVSDGRQAPLSLLVLPTDDIRYPSLERRSNRRFGMVTLMRAFTETVNVLNNALTNRYSIKGIGGTTSTNPNFMSATEVVLHASFSGPFQGNASTTIGLYLTFPTAEELNTFLHSGGAVQIKISHNPGGSATVSDTNFKTLLDQRGVLRLTADKTRVFGNVFPLALAVAPVSAGLKDAPATGRPLTTQAIAGASYNVSAATTSANILYIVVDLYGGAAMNGTTTIVYDIVRDRSTYSAPAVTPAFGSPRAFTAGDKVGTTLLN